MKFKKEYLTDELDLPRKPGVYAGVTVHENRLVDRSRWSLEYEIIFSIDGGNSVGEAWLASYSRGATESQDEGPWENEDEVEATLVRLVEKTVKMWEPVQ